MKSTALETSRLRHLTGFGMVSGADAFVFEPRTEADLIRVFQVARESGRKVALRGNGRSYGDANIAEEAIVLDIRRMNRILDWNPETGVLHAEAGVTIEQLWRTSLGDGWWPPVVSGTMFPTLAGALAMNIHGKNAFHSGTIGEHVLEIRAVLPNGTSLTLTPADDAFYELISSAGLLAAITEVKIQMRAVASGDLRVLPLSIANWDEQFATFESLADEADYLVSWIDAFASGRSAGRGLIHAAWYQEESGARPHSLREDHQDLPDTLIFGLPKSMMSNFLRPFNRRGGMRLINAAKFRASRLLGNGRPHPDGLVGFSFLLDYVPNWRNAYQPGGFIQYQSFVPKEHARRVFAEQFRLAQEAKLEPFLAVMKRHRPDRFLFSHAVDGYSLALDFKHTTKRHEDLWRLCHRMNDLVLAAGGRFYFAKDSTLRPSDVAQYLGEETIARFRARKAEWDSEGMLTSGLAQRVGLI